MNGDAGAWSRETAPKPCLSSVLVDRVIGRTRRPRLSDRPQLPYLEAFILETFRHSSSPSPSHTGEACFFRPHTPEVFSLFSLLLLSPGPGQTLASPSCPCHQIPPRPWPLLCPHPVQTWSKYPGVRRKLNSDLSSHSPLLTFPPSVYSTQPGWPNHPSRT